MTDQQKHKTPQEMPPLSDKDKRLYWLAMGIGAVLILGLILTVIFTFEPIAFHDPQVLAAAPRVSMLWILPTVCLLGYCIYRLREMYIKRVPLFGLQDVKYGKPNYPNIFPVFVKNKRKRKMDRKKCTAFILATVLCLTTAPWAFTSRDCLSYEGHLVHFNIFGMQTKVYPADTIEVMEYILEKEGITGKWSVTMTITTDDDKTYSFSSGNFRVYWLDEMLRLKKLYSAEIISYHNVDHLEDVVEDQRLTAEQAQLLYTLFNKERTQ